MATQASPTCVCTGGRDEAPVSLHEIFEAMVIDDIGRAIEAGLLRWNGCIACANASGLNRADAEKMRAARESRLSALAARERYRARQQRLQQRSAQRDGRRTAASTASPQPSVLPSAAAAALTRAKAKPAARAKS